MKHFLFVVPLCTLLLFTSCSQSPQKLIATANKYHDNKKYKEASILYRKAISKDKTNADAYYREGLNLLDQKNPVEARSFLRRAVDLNPNNVDAASKLAEIDLAVYSRNPEKLKSFLSEAKDLTAKILQVQPNAFDGIRLQGLLDLANRDIDNALTEFEKANKIKPYSPELVGWYAQALISAKRPDEAESLLRGMIAHDKTWGPAYDTLFVLYRNQNHPEKAEAVLRERVQNDPKNPTAITNLANYLLATNRFDEAEKVMRRVLDDKSDFPSAREMMGDFYVRAKKPDQAIEQYKVGAKEDSKNELTYQERLVAVYTLTGRRGEAFQLAKQLASKNPKDNTANNLYASLLLSSETNVDPSKKADEIKGMVQNNPNNPTLHLDLARAYLQAGKSDQALTEALESVRQQQSLMPAHLLAARIYEDRGEHSKAVAETGTVLAAEPKNPEAELIRDRAFIGLNQLDQAQSGLEALTQQYPNVSEARLALGDLYLRQQQYAKAIQEYQHVWSSNPPDPRGFLGLQNVKAAQGKGPEAAAALSDFIQKNPRAAGFRLQLANIDTQAAGQLMKSNPAEAKQYLEQAADNYQEVLKTNPSSVELWLRLGFLQRALGQLPAALASFQQAGKADPGNANAVLNQGMTLEAMGNKKEAESLYNKVLGMDPGNAVALNNLAFLSADSGGDLDRAMSLAERAKKQAPTSPDVSDTLGYVYYQKNLNAAAVQIFRQIVQDQPNNPTFRLHLAMALLKQGDKQGAREQAQKALRDASQPDEQSKIRAFVNQIG
ncbi:MAG TPA: tetratricopeptide repeat protein [Bryobacteraceae bacterium]|nr:tetratricopeptide repeat protein [Bryobacteraceae bacterium]